MPDRMRQSSWELFYMKYILATKENMTQLFLEGGKVVPVTVLKTGPCVVTQVKTQEKDGYDAIQIGFGEKREALVSKPERGHLAGKGPFRFLREIRLIGEEGEAFKKYNVGDSISLEQFVPGDNIMVSGITKGKGFQGVVKRHGFAGGPRTHGQKHSEREPGSIGGGLRTRVPKGMRMAGRMGGVKRSVLNLKIVEVDTITNQLFVSGAVPGRRGTLLVVETR